MKKLLLLLCFIVSLHAENFGYGDLQSMGGFPMAGVGFRMRQNNHAIDLSANVCVWPSPTIYHGKALYMLYPRGGCIYLGGGFGLINISRDLSSSLEATLGYQWTGRYPVFAELNALYPLYPIGEPGWERTLWPGLTFGVGF